MRADGGELFQPSHSYRPSFRFPARRNNELCSALADIVGLRRSHVVRQLLEACYRRTRVPTTFKDIGWDQLQHLRAELEAETSGAPSLVAAAQRFTGVISASFSTVALARMFLVGPLGSLPQVEQAWATKFAAGAGRVVPLTSATSVLCLLGTSGVEQAWNQREASAGHRAIPLVDRQLVEGAPMLAELLAALDVKLGWSRDDVSVQLRTMSGGLNSRFFVADATSAVDARGRSIIAARDFVARYDIRSVFGMGGTYVDGRMAIFIAFTREALVESVVDRFSSFISTFKISTAQLVTARALFE